MLASVPCCSLIGLLHHAALNAAANMKDDMWVCVHDGKHSEVFNRYGDEKRVQNNAGSDKAGWEKVI